jgi:hypothetical protein
MELKLQRLMFLVLLTKPRIMVDESNVNIILKMKNYVHDSILFLICKDQI